MTTAQALKVRLNRLKSYIAQEETASDRSQEYIDEASGIVAGLEKQLVDMGEIEFAVMTGFEPADEEC